MPIEPSATRVITSPSIIPNAKRDTVLTTLLLLDLNDLNLRRQILDSIQRGSARIDEDLMFALYTAGDPPARLAIAMSVATSRMRPHAFRRIFDPVFERSDLSVHQRLELMWTLRLFLRLNPRESPAYEHIFFEMTRSPHFDLRVNGIQGAAECARVDADFLALIKHRLKSRSPIIRLASVAAYHLMVNRLDQLAPEIREFLTSDALWDNANQLRRSDPDEHMRLSCRHLIMKLRRIRSPRKRRTSRSGRRS